MMSKLLDRLKNPSRLIKHASIKYLDKKISRLSEIEAFFKYKKGLEIGGPSKIFSKIGYVPVYPLADTVDGVNFSTTTVWENTISEGKTYNFGEGAPGYQFIQDGTDLSVIKPETYDFLLSSHSLEHMANPIKALTEWLRILKRGGAILVVVPDKRYTFDCKRPVTKFEHLHQDFKDNTPESDLTHFEEIVALHDIPRDAGIQSLEEFKERSMNNFTNRCLHHHVFDLKLMEQVFKYFNLKVVLKDSSPPFNLIIMGVKEA
jgi:SAM-dependent methyltransferase